MNTSPRGRKLTLEQSVERDNIIWKRYLEGLQHKTIAARLGVSLTTVQMVINRKKDANGTK